MSRMGRRRRSMRRKEKNGRAPGSKKETVGRVMSIYAVHSTLLHWIYLHCIAHYCIALHITALHCGALHYNALQCTAVHFTKQ